MLKKNISILKEIGLSNKEKKKLKNELAKGDN